MKPASKASPPPVPSTNGTLKAPRRPVRVDGSREIDVRPPPDLGEHTVEILNEIGFDSAAIETLRRTQVI